MPGFEVGTLSGFVAAKFAFPRDLVWLFCEATKLLCPGETAICSCQNCSNFLREERRRLTVDLGVPDLARKAK